MLPAPELNSGFDRQGMWADNPQKYSALKTVVESLLTKQKVHQEVEFFRDFEKNTEEEKNEIT